MKEWDLGFISLHIPVGTAHHWSVASVGWRSPRPEMSGDCASLYEVRAYSQGKEGFYTVSGRAQMHFIVLTPLIPKDPSHHTDYQIIRC